MRRFVAAVPAGPRAATLVPGADDAVDARFVATDIFRRAHVHFNLYGRALRVRVPGPPGIMHFTYPVPLRLDGWANLYTVHDVIPITHPELTPIKGRRHRRLLAAIAGDAARLVTVSEAARRAIVTALGCEDGFVTDCAQAVAIPAGGHARPNGVPDGRYLLVCGTVEPRKNIARILAAYRASGVALPLLIAGPDGWHARASSPTAIAATPGAIRVPFLPREGMLGLIAGAHALLMPSLAEGFGLPVIEAMALGTPVLTSSRGALMETAGGAALLVDPTDTDAIAAGIAALADDDALCVTLRAAGRQCATDFTLDRFAARLGALYQDVIAPAR